MAEAISEALPDASYSKCAPALPSHVTFGPVPNEFPFSVVIRQFPLEPSKPVPVHPAGAVPEVAPKVSVNTKVDPPEEHVTPTGGGGGVFNVVKFIGPAQTLVPLPQSANT